MKNLMSWRWTPQPLNGVSMEVLRSEGVVPNGRQLIEARLDAAKSLYRRDLLCHYGCVNALEFSRDGQLLVSGGDDRRVVLWNFGKTLLQQGQPEQMVSQHLSNIFCLAITKDNSRIFSGGNDDQVMVHDSNTKQLIEVLPHQNAVCGIAIDPFDPQVLATAGNDGRLLVFDTRQSIEESLVVSRSRKAFHAVAFHPLQGGIIVAANARNGAALWDLRKPKHAIIRYGSGNGISQNCMSVRFNKSGDQILALRRRMPPVLYSIDSSEPRAYFYHSDYYNSCTTKSCCFAGDADQYVLSGSDDFNLYMWKIPDTPEKTPGVQTHLILYGHRSIVNQVRYNPQYCVIASSGVEKIIKLWSPVQIAGSKGSLLEEQSGPDNPRDVYSHEEYVSLVHHSGTYPATDQSTSEDPRMMALFDSLVQREIEGWSADETDSQSGNDSIITTIDNTSHFTRVPLANQMPHPTLPKDSDSSDSDQMLIHILPKRVLNGMRNQRCQNRIARLIATRQSKLLRLTQKRITPRCHKTQQNLSSAACVNKRIRAPRPLRARRGVRRGGPSPPLPLTSSSLVNTSVESPATDSDPDSDIPPSPRSLHRHMSKMNRPNRRRMSVTRNLKKRTKVSNYCSKGFDYKYDNVSRINRNHENHYNDNSFSDDNLAVPSTSTGIRSHHNTALFRITEADSDDDQSGESCPKSSDVTRQTSENTDLPLVKILPTPINGSRDIDKCPLELNISWENDQPNRLYDYNRLLEDDFRNSSDPFHLSVQNWEQPRNSTVMGYSQTLSRLKNETNESEVESSCSTRSTADDTFTPNKLISANFTTPESGIHTGPCTSSGSRSTISNLKSFDNLECSDEPEWVVKKHRQKVKRVRRNYRNHIGESDSN